MKNGLKFLPALLALILVAGACKKELDLEVDAYYGVRQFLQSKNCDTKCGQVADCEGEIVGVKGKVNVDATEREALTFYLSDENHRNCDIEVRVDSLIATDVFDQLLLAGNTHARVKGLVEGFDQPGNLKCKRGFVLLLENEEDLLLD